MDPNLLTTSPKYRVIGIGNHPKPRQAPFLVTEAQRQDPATCPGIGMVAGSIVRLISATLFPICGRTRQVKTAGKIRQWLS